MRPSMELGQQVWEGGIEKPKVKGSLAMGGKRGEGRRGRRERERGGEEGERERRRGGEEGERKRGKEEEREEVMVET